VCGSIRQPALSVSREVGQPRRKLVLVPAELLGIAAAGRVEPADLIRQLKEPAREAASDAADRGLPWHQAVAHVSISATVNPTGAGMQHQQRQPRRGASRSHHHHRPQHVEQRSAGRGAPAVSAQLGMRSRSGGVGASLMGALPLPTMAPRPSAHLLAKSEPAAQRQHEAVEHRDCRGVIGNEH
jgi:hypothetical protein